MSVIYSGLVVEERGGVDGRKYCTFEGINTRLVSDRIALSTRVSPVFILKDDKSHHSEVEAFNVTRGTYVCLY